MKEEEYESLCDNCKRDLDRAHSTNGRRQAGKTAEMLTLIADLEAQGKTVLVIGPNTQRPPLLGAAMPPLEDVELNRALDYADKHGMAYLKNRRGGPMPFFPHYPPMSSWVQSYFEAWEKAKQDGLEGVLMLKHRQSVRMPTVIEMEKRIDFLPDFLKAAKTRETPRVKHNPKPSRMAFLDGLGRKKKFRGLNLL